MTVTIKVATSTSQAINDWVQEGSTRIFFAWYDIPALSASHYLGGHVYNVYCSAILWRYPCATLHCIFFLPLYWLKTNGLA